MNKPLVSIIIPTYNSHEYINECLNSIIKQSYTNLEIIVVDDDSKDNTLDIVCDYKDPRIKLYKKTNEGVSAARNYGLTKVTGDYILFIDSDDYLINNDVINTLINNINDTDIIRYSYSKLIDNKLINEDISSYKDEYDNGESFINSVLSINKKYSWYLWQYLFKKELWKGITFPVGKIFEDTATIYKVLLRANKIKVIKDQFYVYRFNPISLSKKVNLKICLDMIDVISDTKDNINNLDIKANTKALLLNNISYGYITDVDVLYTLDNNDRKVLRKKLIDNKYLLDYLIYNKEVIIKYLIKIIGIDNTSKLLNVRRKLWKK